MTDRTDRLASWGIILLVGLLDLSCIKGDFVALKPTTVASNPAPSEFGPSTPRPEVTQPTSWLTDIALGGANLLALINIADRRLFHSKQAKKS